MKLYVWSSNSEVFVGRGERRDDQLERDLEMLLEADGIGEGAGLPAANFSAAALGAGTAAGGARHGPGRRALRRTLSVVPPSPAEMERGGVSLLAELFEDMALSGDAVGEAAAAESRRSRDGAPCGDPARSSSGDLGPAASGASSVGRAEGAPSAAASGSSLGGSLSGGAGAAAARSPAPHRRLAVAPMSFVDVPDRARAPGTALRVQMEDAQRRLLGFLPEGAACRRVRTKDDGACSLHAAFGSLDARSGCVCAEARARAAEALESFLCSVSADGFAEELRRASSVSSKVVAAFWGMALKRGFAGDEGPEAGLWWDACPQNVRERVGDVVRRHEEAVALQDANFRDFADVCREVCVSWGNAGLLVRRIALEVHGLDVGSLPGDIESICDSQLHQWLGPAFDAVRGQLIVKGTASTPIPFPDDGPANKYLALFDARPAFDVLRKAFFITGALHHRKALFITGRRVPGALGSIWETIYTSVLIFEKNRKIEFLVGNFGFLRFLMTNNENLHNAKA